ncbi:nucleoside 2-deoxyribosyltransferase [Salirhabdus sp. Marseille-P4669]|uniref:nucleoside 2-deoxyribosyltransferase n=1 Tax=Salirhabdus sp. Marseille-P4669 TaxID=2042310 RepID=UPI000C79DBA8|nr:nucleoside 2-deoxyribosyltransferase [Salirhabdus sp. Marseille-P4669]
MKFYIASSLKNRELVRYVARRLENKGHVLTYDWTKNERVENYEDLKAIGEAEIKGVKEADFVVMLMPGGVGSHVELGIALGLGKRVYLYTQDHDIYDITNTCTFYYVNGVHKFAGFIENFILEIDKYESKLLH